MTKPIAPSYCTPCVQELHTRAEVVHLTPGLLGIGVLFNCQPIAPFSCTPCVQVVHTKAEVVHLTPGLLGLGVLFNCHA